MRRGAGPTRTPGSEKTALSRAIAEVRRLADQPNAVIDLDDLDDLSKVYRHPRRSFALENLQVIWPSRSAPSATKVAIHFDVDGTGLSHHPRMAASRQFARARWRFLLIPVPILVPTARRFAIRFKAEQQRVTGRCAKVDWCGPLARTKARVTLSVALPGLESD